MPLMPLQLALNRALNSIAGATRGAVVSTALDLADVPWVKAACARARDSDVTCLGRFDLLGPDGATPWPSILVAVKRPARHSGQANRTALIAVYVSPTGSWACAVREDGVIPWKQFRGSRDGEPSVLNGDRPADSPDAPA